MDIMPTSNESIVVNINSSFFAKSETFIDQYIFNLNKSYHIYLAKEFVTPH